MSTAIKDTKIAYRILEGKCLFSGHSIFVHISTYDESRLFCTSFFQIEITHRTFAFSVLRSDSFLALIMIRAGSKYVLSERKKSAQEI